MAEELSPAGMAIAGATPLHNTIKAAKEDAGVVLKCGIQDRCLLREAGSADISGPIIEPCTLQRSPIMHQCATIVFD